MVGWYHQLDGQGFEQAPGVGHGQGSLACCSPWGCKELDMTEWQLNWTEVCHSFSFKEQASFIFMAAVTISGDFGARENKICHCFHFPSSNIIYIYVYIICIYTYISYGVTLMAHMLKNLSVMQETQVCSLGLEKEMATHFNILAWRIRWTEEPGRLESMRVTELNTTEWLSLLLPLLICNIYNIHIFCFQIK